MTQTSLADDCNMRSLTMVVTICFAQSSRVVVVLDAVSRVFVARGYGRFMDGDESNRNTTASFMVETLATGRELSHTFSCETMFGDDGLVGMLETIGKTKVLGGIFPHRSFLLVDCVVNRTRKSKLFTIGRNRAGQLLSVGQSVCHQESLHQNWRLLIVPLIDR